MVHKVTSYCDSSNVASEKVMKKAGMMLIDNSGTRFYPKTGVTSSIKIISISPCFCSYDFPIRETRENSFGANCLINVCYFVSSLADERLAIGCFLRGFLTENFSVQRRYGLL